MSTLDKINQLKKERNAVILAHYYVSQGQTGVEGDVV